jgi:hypothetical protein
LQTSAFESKSPALKQGLFSITAQCRVFTTRYSGSVP